MGVDGPTEIQESAGTLANSKINPHFENNGELIYQPLILIQQRQLNST